MIKNFKKFYEADEESEFKVYVDLDSVLVDWEEGFNQLSPNKSMGDWEDEDNEEGGWKLIHDAGEEWWANLPWMKDGKKLWEFVKQFDPTILTSPGTQEIEPIIKAKNVWIDRELGDDVPRIIDREKQKYAKKNSILVDDQKGNIKRWEDAGGIGVRHTKTEDTIEQLTEIMGLREDLMNPVKNFNKKKFFDTKKADKKSKVTFDLGF